jgi:putative membrane protein
MFRFVAVTSFLLACTVLAAQETNTANRQQSEAKNRQNQADQSNDQKQARDGQNSPSGQASRTGQGQGADHHFATCVAFGNQEEVILGQLASEKAQSEEVKRFAEMMVKDHQQYLSKLQKFAPEAARQGALGSTGSARTKDSDPNDASADTRSKTNQAAGQAEKDSDNQARNTDAKRDGTATDSRTGANASHSMMQVERELAEQCVKSARQKLESKTGADFDKCYMHAQVAKHAAMKDKLTVFQRHTSQELSQVFAEGLKTTEHHLAQAEEIAKSLDQGGASGRKSTWKAKETRENK